MTTSIKRSLPDWFWLASPFFIWFSYYPSVQFGHSETLHFKISLALVFVVIMGFINIPSIYIARKKLVKNKIAILATVWLGLSAITLFWTPVVLRGFTTIAMAGSLYLILLGTLAKPQKFHSILPQIVKNYIIASVIASIIAIIQFFAGAWLEQDITLLCSGCVVEQFGFARPNLFLIEPQFFANVLLPPLLILCWRILQKTANKSEHIAFMIIGTTLILTLSRGAIFAFVAGIIIIFFLSIRNWASTIKGLSLILTSVIIALILQGTASTITPKTEQGFGAAVNTSINQLSMGLIKIKHTNHEEKQTTENPDFTPAQTPATQTENSVQNQAQQTSDPDVAQPMATTASVNPNAPNFSGYVEESTSARTFRSQLALKRWEQDPQTIVFGTGLGSAGYAIHQKFPDELSALEIVQNEYVEKLLEQGIIGFTSWIIVLIGLILITRKYKWLWAIIVAFCVQWMSFSGYPNALHAYLALIAVAVYTNMQTQETV